MAEYDSYVSDSDSENDLNHSIAQLQITKNKKGERSWKRQRYYGFFRCVGCQKNWESAHVYIKNKKGEKVG